MGSNIANSKLLDHIFVCAEHLKINKGNKILTVNHIFAAVLEYINESKDGDNISLYGDESEAYALANLFSGITLPDDISVCIELLCSKKDSYVDDLLFRQIVSSSRAISEQNGSQILSADIFLKCIIDSPTDEIKAILLSSSSNNSKESSLSEESLSKATEEFRKFFVSDDKTEELKEKSADTTETEIIDEKNNNLKPREQISLMTKKVKNMQKQLSSVVFGQDNAINIFVSGYFQAELRNLTDKSNKKPRATYLFAGPPGVGKTFLAEQAAEMLKIPFMRFDMREFSERDALMELLGTNKSFKGDKEGALTGFVEKNPKCVLLFDEIEKANIAVIHLFLQVLDAGRLRDTNTGREVDFSQAVIIFTTNAGRKIYEDSLTPNLSSVSRKNNFKGIGNRC